MGAIGKADYRQYIKQAGVEFESISTDVPPGNLSSYPWSFQDTDNRDAVRFRERFMLDQVISGARDEWHAIRLLRHWACTQMPRGGNRGHRSAPNANAETMLLASNAGASFNCTYFNRLACSVFASMGWVCRRLTINFVNAQKKVQGHAVHEVWVNELKKWVVMDARYDTHYEFDSVPLSACEIRKLSLQGRGTDVKVCTQPENIAVPKNGNGMNLPANIGPADAFPWIRYQLLNTPFNSTGSDQHLKVLLLTDEANPTATPFEKGHAQYESWASKVLPVTDLSEIYFDCNSVSLQPHTAAYWGPGILVFNTITCTPNLSHLEISQDRDSWRPHTNVSRVQWTLHEGDNALKVRTVNKFGRPGPAASIELKGARIDYQRGNSVSYTDDDILLKREG